MRVLVAANAFSGKIAGGSSIAPVYSTVERVLRYPGGIERRIRYPSAPPMTEETQCVDRVPTVGVASVMCDPEDDGCLVDDLYWSEDHYGWLEAEAMQLSIEEHERYFSVYHDGTLP
jgi:hypothetical protein